MLIGLYAAAKQLLNHVDDNSSRVLIENLFVGLSSHNLLVRGSNPCGGTKDIADLRLQIADFVLGESRNEKSSATIKPRS